MESWIYYIVRVIVVYNITRCSKRLVNQYFWSIYSILVSLLKQIANKIQIHKIFKKEESCNILYKIKKFRNSNSKQILAFKLSSRLNFFPVLQRNVLVTIHSTKDYFKCKFSFWKRSEIRSILIFKTNSIRQGTMTDIAGAKG